MANTLRFILVMLGLATIGCSLFVATFSATDVLSATGVKTLSFISAMALGVLAAFNIAGKGNNARNAFRHLMYAKELFLCDKLTEEELVKAHAEAEVILGSVEFNYAMPRAIKPGGE